MDLLTSDSLEGPFIQDIGGLHCSTASDQGEITFSKQGDKVAVIYQYDGKFDLFDFDRCTGLLSNFNEIVANNPYGAEFSPDGRLLYVSEGANGFGGVFQYDLTTSDISSTRLPVWINTDSNVYVGQLELAPNKKIYLSSVEGQFNFPVNFPFDSINQHLGVINFPDQIGVACNFQPFSFYLGDSARSLVGLPNMPNYNLGPTSVYLADAGKDTVYCSNLSNGTTIGVPPVANIIYSWTPSRGLSDTTIAQPPD